MGATGILIVAAIPIILAVVLTVAGIVTMSKRKKAGKSIAPGVVMLVLGVLLVPLALGMIGFFWFLGVPEPPPYYDSESVVAAEPPAGNMQCKASEPCKVLMDALGALEKNDIASFRRAFLPDERRWIDELPQVSAAPQLQGRLIAEALMGRDTRHMSLEDLQRNSNCRFGFEQSRTALDGQSAELHFTRICQHNSAFGTVRAVRYEESWLLERPD